MSIALRPHSARLISAKRQNEIMQTQLASLCKADNNHYPHIVSNASNMRPCASHVLHTMLRISTNLVLDIHIIYSPFLASSTRPSESYMSGVYFETGSHAKQCVKSFTLTFSTSIYACMFYAYLRNSFDNLLYILVYALFNTQHDQKAPVGDNPDRVPHFRR